MSLPSLGMVTYTNSIPVRPRYHPNTWISFSICTVKCYFQLASFRNRGLLMIYHKVSPASPDEEPIIFLVDDDESLRESLRSLFRSVGYKVEVFGSSAELLQRTLPDIASCLVLDVRLPGLSGLDLQTELVKARIHLPIIFITGHGDIPMSVKAMKAGAVDFLSKPF